MARNPRQDEIKTIYKLEATEAQQQLHALKKTNQELTQVADKRRNEMVKLEAQGKKNTQEYKRLAAANREDSKAIRENTKLIREQEEAMGVTSLTMNQLRSRAKSLRMELNNISKEIEPERWTAVNSKLSETNKRMAELRNNSTTLSKNLRQSFLSKTTFASFLGNFYANMAMKLGQAIGKVKEFISQSTELAAKAQGVDHAFSKIANKDYLQSLREQTKGLISDFTLMQSAVRAENFEIPLNQLGTLLEFAQNRARDTGESVDYLVESIINGIGRKSPLILDNLGISAVRLQEEVKKTGDFAGAVGKIIEEEMAKAGPAIDTAADAATRKKVAWENLQLATGKFFVGFREGWDNFTTSFANGLTNLLSGKENLILAYDKQIERVTELEATLYPLIDEYKELKEKQENLKDETKLSKEEHERLQVVMQTLSNSLPGVIDNWDEYGRITSVNTDKIYEFIQAEKIRLQYMNKTAIAQAEKDKKKAEKKIEKLNKDKESYERGYDTKTVTDRAHGESYEVQIPWSKKRKEKYEAELKEWGDMLAGAEAELARLNGSTWENDLKISKERYEQKKKFNAMNKEELEKWLKDESNAESEYKKIAQSVYNSRSVIGADEGDKREPKGKSKSDINKEKYNSELSALEDSHKEKILLLKKQMLEEKQTEEWFKTESIALQEQYFKDKIALQKQFGQSTIDTETQQADFELNLQKSTDELKLRAMQDLQESGLKAIEMAEKTKLVMLSESAAMDIITQKEYEREKLKARIEAEKARLELAKEIYKKTSELSLNDVEQQKKKLEELQSLIDSLTLQLRSADVDLFNFDNKDESSIKDKMDEIFGNSYSEIGDMFSAFFEGLDSLKKEDLETWEDWAKAIGGVVQSSLAVAKKITGDYFEYKFNALEADKQRELTAAGDNAAERERIEKEYAQKELNLKKKQANADAGIKIAQTITAGALAAMQAWAQLGPIAGPVAAALIAVTTAAQIASILAQRRQIMSTTLDGDGSSSSTTERVVTGLESGGYFPVERKQDRKKYIAKFDPMRRGYINRPTVLVGDGPAGESMEWVASNDALQNPTVAPFIKMLDEAQQAGNIRTIDLNHIMRARMAGFAYGGFVDSQPNVETSHVASQYLTSDNTQVNPIFTELRDLLQHLKKYGIPAKVNYHEFKQADKKIESIKSKARRS